MTETTTTKPMRTPAEIGQRFGGLHHKTVRKWPKRGCPHHRAGRRLFFIDEEVDAWTLKEGITSKTPDTTEATNAAHE